jgi:hypothetical protein
MVAVDGAVPLGVTEAGVILHVVFLGAPEQVRFICWLNPPTGVIVTLVVAELPPFTVPLVCARLMLKSAETGVTVMVTEEDVEEASLASPP